MMVNDGSLAASGKAPELLQVIGRYGDRGAEFVWKNKGALAVGAVALAFVTDPEPFIIGTRELAEIAARQGDETRTEASIRGARDYFDRWSSRTGEAWCARVRGIAAMLSGDGESAESAPTAGSASEVIQQGRM